MGLENGYRDRKSGWCRAIPTGLVLGDWTLSPFWPPMVVTQISLRCRYSRRGGDRWDGINQDREQTRIEDWVFVRCGGCVATVRVTHYVMNTRDNITATRPRGSTVVLVILSGNESTH